MTRIVWLAITLTLTLLTGIPSLDAKPRPAAPDMSWAVRMGLHSGAGAASSVGSEPRRASRGTASESWSGRYNAGPRPGKWCGWWMRTQRGGGPAYNVAWNWRNYGSPASPQVGAVVVWRHHVGQIVGQASDGRWLVQSGNDGGRVRTRPRSVAGAVIRI